MPALTTETILNILINWLRENINCDATINFDNDEGNTASIVLLLHVEEALNDVRDLRHLQLLHREKSG